VSYFPPTHKEFQEYVDASLWSKTGGKFRISDFRNRVSFRRQFTEGNTPNGAAWLALEWDTRPEVAQAVADFKALPKAEHVAHIDLAVTWLNELTIRWQRSQYPEWVDSLVGRRSSAYVGWRLALMQVISTHINPEGQGRIGEIKYFFYPDYLTGISPEQSAARALLEATE